VVSLNVPGRSGGGEISGFNQHDRMVMGLLRAAADAVIVGAGTLRAVPRHRWTAAYICPALAAAYQTLRAALGKPDPPLNVIITARGAIDLDLPVFQSGEVPVLIVTTVRGAQRIGQQELPPSVQLADVQSAGPLSAGSIHAAQDRPGLVAGQVLAPDRPRWGTLVGVKRAGSHLFLRYAFEPPA
jgi:hypothetical protein